MRPEGKLKIEVTFESIKNFSSIEIEEAFRSAALSLKIIVSDFQFNQKSVTFIIEYKINTNLTGVINSLKATSSRSVNSKTGEKFWVAGYKYKSVGV